MAVRPRSDALRNRGRVVAAAAAMRANGAPLQLNVVARNAGVGVGTVYRHFATSEQLTETLVHDRFGDLTRRAGGIRDDDDLRDFLEHSLTVFVHDDDFAAVAMNSQPVLDSTGEARRTLLTALTSAFDRARGDDGPAGALTPAEVLVLLCGLAHAVRVSGADRDQTRRYLDAFLRGVSAPR